MSNLLCLIILPIQEVFDTVFAVLNPLFELLGLGTLSFPIAEQLGIECQ